MDQCTPPLRIWTSCILHLWNRDSYVCGKVLTLAHASQVVIGLFLRSWRVLPEVLEAVLQQAWSCMSQKLCSNKPEIACHSLNKQLLKLWHVVADTRRLGKQTWRNCYYEQGWWWWPVQLRNCCHVDMHMLVPIMPYRFGTNTKVLADKQEWTMLCFLSLICTPSTKPTIIDIAWTSDVHRLLHTLKCISSAS